MPDIDHDSPVTPYRQIAAWIIDRIESGDLRPDRPIPSETSLVQEFGTARTTVRRAVAYLRDEGWVYTVPQRGSYVTNPADQPK